MKHRGKRLLLLIATLCCAIAPGFAARLVTDEANRAVAVPDHPHRILCLVPSITDAVFAIGAGADVAGISDYTEYPPEAKSRPSVGSITRPSIEAILALHPDLVLGMPHANDQAILDQLQRLGIPVFLVDPHGLEGILHSILTLGHAINRDPQAAAEVARLRRRIEAVRARVQGRPAVPVFMPISYDPAITIGRGAFITEIIAVAGGRSITDDIGQEWPHVSMEAVIARAPQALLMMRGGHVTIAGLRQRPGWEVLPAVRTGRVYYVDPRVDFPSPVAIDALEDLARQFHP